MVIEKEKNMMIPLTMDFAFKRVFDLNPELLKRFLISVLKLDLKEEITDMRMGNTELSKTYEKEYQKRVDIIVEFDNKITIDIEINTGSLRSFKQRNVLYGTKIYSTMFEKGRKRSDFSNYYMYQLNLNTKPDPSGFGERECYLMDKNTYEIQTENLKFVHKFLDYYRQLYYNGVENVSQDVIWLAMLTTKNFQELESIASRVMDSYELKKFMKDVREMSVLDFSIHEWEKDKIDEWMRAEEEKYQREQLELATKKALEEGTRQGMERGIEQGIVQGIEQGTRQGMEQGQQEMVIKHVKSMLENHVDLEIISKVTGKTFEEIKEIEQL